MPSAYIFARSRGDQLLPEPVADRLVGSRAVALVADATGRPSSPAGSRDAERGEHLHEPRPRPRSADRRSGRAARPATHGHRVPLDERRLKILAWSFMARSGPEQQENGKDASHSHTENRRYRRFVRESMGWRAWTAYGFVGPCCAGHFNTTRSELLLARWLADRFPEASRGPLPYRDAGSGRCSQVNPRQRSSFPCLAIVP
jgi:hypothetical protein